MKRLLQWSLIVLLIFVVVGCQTADGDSGSEAAVSEGGVLPLDGRIQTGTLENGLTWFIQPNQTPSGRASLRLVVNAGSVLEEDDQQGLAHFVEHMAFNGTVNFEKQELVDYFESIGMTFGPEVNAYTSFDETVYMLEIPTDDQAIIKNSFQVLEDWAHGIVFEAEEVELERGVIHEEWRLRRGAQGRVQDELMKVLFEGSAYADRSPIGLMDVVDNAPRQRLVDFYEKWYRPDLMAVVVTGDVDPGQIQGLIESHFSYDNPSEPLDRPQADVPEINEMRSLVVADPELAYAEAQLIVRTPKVEITEEQGYRDFLRDYFAFQLVAKRLEERTMEEEPPYLYAVTTFQSLVRGTMVNVLYVVDSPEGILSAYEAASVELRRAVEFGFSEGELDRLKNDFLNRYEQIYEERDNTQSSSLADQIVSYFLDNEPLPGPEFDFNFLKEVMPGIGLDEVQTRLGEMYGTDDRMIFVTLPEGGDLPTEEDFLQVQDAVSAMKLEAWGDDFVAGDLVPAVPERGRIVAEDYYEAVDVHTFTLDNGVEVVYKVTDFDNDYIQMKAISPGGDSHADDEHYLSAVQALSFLNESGLGDFSAADLEKQLSGIQAQVSPLIGEYFEGFSGGTPTEDLETLFQLIHLYFYAPRFDEPVFNSIVSRLETVVENRSNDPHTQFSDRIRSVLGQGHVRTQPLTIDNLDSLSLEAAREFYLDRFADGSDFTFIFSGTIDPEQLKELSEVWLGSLPSLNRDEQGIDLGIRPPEGVHLEEVNKGLEEQSTVVLIFTGEQEFSDRDELLYGEIGEVVAINLREELRERLSGVYGVGASVSLSRYPEGLVEAAVYFGCDPNRVEELVDAVFNEIAVMMEEGISEEDVVKVREAYRRNYEVALEENGFWVSHLETAVRDGMPLDDLLTPEEYNEIISAESMTAALKDIYDFENYIRFALYPENSGE